MAHLADDGTRLSYVRAHGFTEEAARRRVEVGDLVDVRGHALEDAVESVRCFYCLSLDGPFERAEDPGFNGVLGRLETAWREFHDAVDEAKRIVEGK